MKKMSLNFKLILGFLGVALITARGYTGESTVAYAPVIEALRGALARLPNAKRLAQLPTIWLSEAARLLPELIAQRHDVPSPPALIDASARARFRESMLDMSGSFEIAARNGIGCLNPGGGRRTASSIRRWRFSTCSAAVLKAVRAGHLTIDYLV